MATLPAPASTIAPAAGRPDLAWLALNPRAWTTEAAGELAGRIGPNAVADAIAQIEDRLAPVPRDPEGRASWLAAIDERLRRLAVKVAPGMAPAQTEEWRKVMADALSDLPAMVALTAAKRALHVQMTYMNEIEGAVRAQAAVVIAERRIAVERLRLLAVQMRQTGMRRLEDRRADPLTDGEVAALSPDMRAMGLKCGAITQEQIDAALAAAGVVTTN